MKNRFLFGSLVAAVVLVGLWSVNHHPAPLASVPPPAPKPPVAVSSPPLPSAVTTPEPVPISMSDSGAPPPAPEKIAGTKLAATSLAPAKGGKVKELKDPLARIALDYVGADPMAEAYWMDAINDPTLPANERQDLIEDLNENGLSDPKHPSLEDLSLIVSRLELIEQLAPDAMDKVNADAFDEAYKDLINLGNLAMGGGTPVN